MGVRPRPPFPKKVILGTGPTLAQELGGEGFGAAVAQFNRLLVSGVGKKGSFEELARLGLIDKSDVANIPGTGEGQGLKAGRKVTGWQLAQSDPNEWVKQYLLPAFDRAGIKDKDEQLREVGVLFQSQRAAQLVDLLATQQPRINKDMALLNKPNLQGLSAADNAIREDPGLAWTGLKSSIDSLVGATGESVKFAGVVTDAAQAISRFTEDLARRSQTDESVFDITKRKLGWLAAPFNWIAKPGEDPGQAAREKQFRTLNPTGLSGHHIPSSTPGLYEIPPPPSSAAPASLGRDVRSPPSASPQAQPEAVSVTGQARVQHNVHVDLKIDPLLRVKVDQSTNVLDFTVPLNGGTARKDSGAAAQRASGIGSM
jgi:hypothetical protein